MSHTKYALFSGLRDGAPTVEVVAPQQTTFAAGALPRVRDFLRTLIPDPKYTYVLVNAMGYSEYFGSNSNADWYGHNSNLDFNGLLHAPPDFGADIVKDRMQGKDWAYGYPTFYGATAYAHHKNTNPQELGFGDVIYVGLNPGMKRVELVIRIFNEEAIRKGHGSILDRLRAGERCDVSMGTRIPWDACSICTDWATVKKAWGLYDPSVHKHPGVAILAYHKLVAPIRGLSEKPDFYCRCMKEMKNKILLDGRKVFVFNDFLRFFDISFVWIGADKTARAMWHLMPRDMPTITGPIATPVVDPQTRLLELIAKALATKTASAKTSEMDKILAGGLAEAVLDVADSEQPIAGLGEASELHGSSAVLSSLAAAGILLRPSEFGDVVGANTRSLEEGTSPSSRYTVSPGAVNQAVLRDAGSLAYARSSFAPFLAGRLMQRDPPSKKTASFTRAIALSSLSEKLAQQYDEYRLSVLEQGPELFQLGVPHLPLAGHMHQKTSSDALALLLLGLAPMIHLVAAHLREKGDTGSELGAMSTFVAENPTFTSVSTIGAGLRAAMGVEAAGGILPAARTLLNAARAVL